MKTIIFRCLVDGEINIVDLSILYGGHSCHVMINKRFITSLDFRQGEWVMLCNNKSWLTSDELRIFIDHLDAEVVYEEEI